MQDLAVGAVGAGGAVGVDDEFPAPSVNTDIVVELAYKGTIAHGGLAAVPFVTAVVHVAVDGGAVAAWPGAMAVA